MKRMTSSNYNPCVNCIYSSSCSHIKYNAPVCPERARYDRLAAYEETGMEPEEIELLAKQRAFYVDACGELPLKRIRELAQADRMIGKEVWAQAKYLNVFQTKSSFIQRTTIQYVSLLKGKDILCHTQTCAFPLNEIGKTVFSTRAEAEAALRREQDG